MTTQVTSNIYKRWTLYIKCNLVKQKKLKINSYPFKEEPKTLDDFNIVIQLRNKKTINITWYLALEPQREAVAGME